MIAFIIIVSLALIWLAWETDYFTMRLPVGAVKIIDKTVPYWWQSPEAKEKNLILCQGCDLWRNCKARKSQRWMGWKLPNRTIKAWGSTMQFNGGCNIGRAEILRQVAYAHKRRPSVSSVITQLPMYIEQVRIGSHHEYVKWSHETQEYDYSNKPKTGYIHRVVEDFTTRYHDCLPGKDWLKEHENDKYPEPLIELSVDGGKSISINGDYKKGTIKEYIKANK